MESKETEKQKYSGFDSIYNHLPHIASVLMEAAIWLIKYGARIAGKEDITEADAKIVHKAFSFTYHVDFASLTVIFLARK